MISRNMVARNFAQKLEQERLCLGLTQAQMAEKLDLSLSGYKRLITGTNTRLDLYLVYTLHELTGKYLFEFIGADDRISHLVPQLRQLSKSQLHFVESVINFELNYSSECNDPDCISVLSVVGDFHDGMLYDTTNIEKINVGPYRKLFGDQLACGVRVSSDHLRPAYNNGDILLIGFRPIRDGDVGIFINKETHRAYLRKMDQAQKLLLPLNSLGEAFELDFSKPSTRDQWIVFGRVLAKTR